MKANGGGLDMTRGPILRTVLLFALPICLGNLLQQLYTTVDTLIISNFSGTVSVAAIGTSAQPVEILQCLFIGFGSGVSILVAQRFGAKDMAELRRITGSVSPPRSSSAARDTGSI